MKKLTRPGRIEKSAERLVRESYCYVSDPDYLIQQLARALKAERRRALREAADCCRPMGACTCCSRTNKKILSLLKDR